MASVKKAAGLATLGLAAALALTGCGSSTPSGNDKPTLIVGTTDRVATLDPAGSYDNGSYTVEIQGYQFLYGFKPGDVTPRPDAAESCEFSEPTVVQCKLKSGLKFANGHALTASDVKFSYDRQVTINHPNGPASLLANLDWENPNRVEVVDELTVNFHLLAENDQTFLQVVASPVGPILDEEVFSPTELTPDDEIVSANAFSGPYTITSFKINDLITFAPYEAYNGVQGTVANGGITLKTYSEATNLKMAITTGEIDVAYRSLTPTDITDLEKNYSDLTVHHGAGGEIRYIVFNFNTMPGDTPEQKLAVRQAIASTIDRAELAATVYDDLYTPLCSWIPDGQAGANQAACETYPLDLTRAAQYLSDAGVTTPVTLDLQYNPDHYGTTSDQEYARIKAQLDASGLFTVNLQSTEWVTFAQERVADVYPLYQLGWFPDFPDPDNYLSPFFTAENFIHNHFESTEIQDLIRQESTEGDHATRVRLLEQIQDLMAERYISTLPLLQGSSIAVARNEVKGVDTTLDASFQFRYASLSK